MMDTTRLQQLHQLLEGELPESQEEELFWALASDDGLRAAFRQLLFLQRALPHTSPTLPSALEDRILQRISSSGGVFRRSRTWMVPLLSALGGAALTAIVAVFALRTPNSPSPTALLVPEPADVTMELPSSAGHPLAREGRLQHPTEPTPSSTSAVPASESPAPEPSLSPAVVLSEVREASSAPRATFLPLQPSLTLPNPGLLTPTAESPLPPLRFSIRSLGIWEASSPEVSLPSRAPLGLRNIALGIASELSTAHSIGIELGSEDFPQEFHSSTGVLYRQRPTLLWAGAWYRWTPPTPHLRPFIQATLGGTLLGPLGKASLGAIVPLRAGLQLSVGVEGTLLAYRFDSRWFVTRKLGLTYGIAIRP